MNNSQRSEVQLSIFLAVIALFLYGASAFADFELQAYQHGWRATGWFDLTWRAAKLPDPWDWIPRDTWHVMQMVRNLAGILATIVATAASLIIPATLERTTSRSHAWLYWVSAVAVSLVLYAIAGGIFRSLPYRIMNVW